MAKPTGRLETFDEAKTQIKHDPMKCVDCVKSICSRCGLPIQHGGWDLHFFAVTHRYADNEGHIEDDIKQYDGPYFTLCAKCANVIDVLWDKFVSDAKIIG